MGILSTGGINWELIKRVQRTTLDTDESRHEGEHMVGSGQPRRASEVPMEGLS